MEYKPKVVLCRLHMAGKTIQQIREECAGQGMTYRDFENIQRANEYFDGVRCRLSLWEWDNYESYHLDDWDAPDDERIEKLIESALEEAKKAWGTNGNLAAYIEPEYVIRMTPAEADEIAAKLNAEPGTIVTLEEK